MAAIRYKPHGCENKKENKDQHCVQNTRFDKWQFRAIYTHVRISAWLSLVKSQNMYKSSLYRNIRILNPIPETECAIIIALRNRHIKKFQKSIQIHLLDENTCGCCKYPWLGIHFVKFATNFLAWTKCATTSRPALVCVRVDLVKTMKLRIR
jgi:hypothetical protein